MIGTSKPLTSPPAAESELDALQKEAVIATAARLYAEGYDVVLLQAPPGPEEGGTAIVTPRRPVSKG